MGTLFEVLLRGEDEEHLTAVADAILDEVQRIEKLLSRFDPRSEISRINRLAAHGPVLVDREVADVLAACIDAWRWTEGAFDVTATSAWRTLPASAGFDHHQADAGSVGHGGVALAPTRRTIEFTAPGTQLDLGGVGKGYALDCAARILDEHHVEHALLHGGTSSVLARGLDEEGEPWRVGFPAAMCETITLCDESLSCSAVDDQADIIDPHSGNALSDPQGVAAIAATATLAEVISTALLCMGRRRAAEFCHTHRLRVRWLDSNSAPSFGSC
jgi:thiamine biosynthesis lipoprotein